MQGIDLTETVDEAARDWRKQQLPERTACAVPDAYEQPFVGWKGAALEIAPSTTEKPIQQVCAVPTRDPALGWKIATGSKFAITHGPLA
ncbi:MAG: hypothetical protein HRT36_06175 [Alphaproteobacteria bacterium]|nr:hypothetical protein [Alphaproteobacteria bacterium]